MKRGELNSKLSLLPKQLIIIMLSFVFPLFPLFVTENCLGLKTQQNFMCPKIEQKQCCYVEAKTGSGKSCCCWSGYWTEHIIIVTLSFHWIKYRISELTKINLKAISYLRDKFSHLLDKLMSLENLNQIQPTCKVMGMFRDIGQEKLLTYKNRLSKLRKILIVPDSDLFLDKKCSNFTRKAMFNYKGYTAQIEIDTAHNLLCGRVLGLKDVITFKGNTVEEARQAFQDSIDDYLDWCEELGEEPEKPFSGRLPYRTTPETHRAIFLAAKKTGKSINSWMDEVLSEEANRIIHA